MTAVTEQATALNRALLEQISEQRNEPTWLHEQRIAAFDLFEQMQWPPHTQDGWRRIDLRKIDLDGLKPVTSSGSAAAAGLLQQRSGLVVQQGAAARQVELSDELKAKGVIFTSLQEAVRTMPQLVEQHLGGAIKSNLNRFTAMNAAFWTGGVFLYVPKDIKIELPLHALFGSDADGTVFSRVLILIDRFSEVTFVSASQSGEASVFNDGVAEIYVGEGAKLRYINVQQWGEKVNDISFQKAVLSPSSKLDLINIGLGGNISRTQVDAELSGAGSETMLTGLYFPRREQYIEYNTLQDHRAASTTSNLLYKGVNEDNGRSVFEGLILVQPEGKLSSSGMTNRNLLLSKTAHADSVPNLEIKANDILKCSHASSLGPVDADALFYLMSRGIPQEVAKQIVVEGFFAEVINKLGVPELEAYLSEAIKTKLGVSGELDIWSSED